MIENERNQKLSLYDKLEEELFHHQIPPTRQEGIWPTKYLPNIRYVICRRSWAIQEFFGPPIQLSDPKFQNNLQVTLKKRSRGFENIFLTKMTKSENDLQNL
ncbi:CLUMA_CG005129, isoform A [Clunio marinus]|uniref:CLUMA_CG005129, isoform A n=1 Tax=Clunio marinus TaxID=568069 RepID=A0A1J1HY55_9DIPT|nr:CLUMA_CG005129, isoform A [Clunio marinus]